MALSMNGVDLSCLNSFSGSTCRAKYSNILHEKYLTTKKPNCLTTGRIAWRGSFYVVNVIILNRVKLNYS
jgi:hypothetical protein